MFNCKGQSSLEFLMIIIVVLALIVLIYSSLPKDTNEITALGIAKNHLDAFILQTNYLGDYNLEVKSNNNDLNILVYFNEKYDLTSLKSTIENISSEVKKASGFQNIYISYN